MVRPSEEAMAQLGTSLASCRKIPLSCRSLPRVFQLSPIFCGSSPRITGTFSATSANGAAFGGLTVVGEFPDYIPESFILVVR